MRCIFIPLGLLALAFSGGVVSADEWTYSGAVQTYVISKSGYYAFTVGGAEGGAFANTVSGGALISGDLYFTAGEVLSILAGQNGVASDLDNAGSGGGMSFIARGSAPIIVAGGGGGVGFDSLVGNPGLVTANGGGIGGGKNGQGGTGAGAGAGWLSPGDGGNGPDVYLGGGGKSAPSYAGGAGSTGQLDPFFVSGSSPGGFGGGGGGGYNCGGGGGGYSGGGGATAGDLTPCYSAGATGGGGSYISSAALNVTAISGGAEFERLLESGFFVQSGFVLLAYTGAVPEPATWTMMVVGFGLAGAILRSRRKSLPVR